MASKHHSDSCCCEFVPFSTVKSTLGSVSLCLESFLFRFSTLVVYFPPNSPSQRSFHPTSISNHPSTHPEQVRITLVHFQLVHPYTRQSQWLLCMYAFTYGHVTRYHFLSKAPLSNWGHSQLISQIYFPNRFVLLLLSRFQFFCWWI